MNKKKLSLILTGLAIVGQASASQEIVYSERLKRFKDLVSGKIVTAEQARQYLASLGNRLKSNNMVPYSGLANFDAIVPAAPAASASASAFKNVLKAARYAKNGIVGGLTATGLSYMYSGQPEAPVAPVVPVVPVALEAPVAPQGSINKILLAHGIVGAALVGKMGYMIYDSYKNKSVVTPAPEDKTPEVVTPEVVTPEVVTPEVVTPEVVTPVTVTPVTEIPVVKPTVSQIAVLHKNNARMTARLLKEAGYKKSDVKSTDLQGFTPDKIKNLMDLLPA